MPAIKKPSRTIFLTFLTFQLLLNATLTNAAVIRRDKREISINVTDTTTSNNEVDSTTITTGKDVGILLYTTESSEDGITTGKSLIDIPTTDGSEEDKKELTTSIGSTIDDNTVSFAKDYQKSYIDSREGDYKIQEKKQQEFTTSISNIDDSTISFITDDQGSHIDSRDGEDKIQEKTKQEFTTSIGYTVDDSTVSFATDHQIFPIHSRGEEDKTEEKTTMESSDKSGNLETSTMNEFKVHTTGRADDIKRTESSIKELPSTTDVSAFESSTVVDDSKSPEAEFTIRPEAIFKEESSAEEQSHFHSILDEEDENKSELSTINFPDFKIETLTSQPIMQTEITTANIQLLNEEPNSHKMVDSTTADADIKLNETTNFKVIDETTTLSAIQVVEVTKIPIKPTENASTPEYSLTELSTKPKETTDSTDNALEVLSTTGLNQAPDFTTNTILPTPSTELRTFTDDVKALTSTLKSDDTTMMLTSTETSDADPVQTTFFANSPVYQEIRILPNASSAEKRGKFIDDNYSSQNELKLPDTSDAWALVGMKTGGKIKSSELQNSVETSDERAINNSMVTKNLLDWTRVMMSTDTMDSESTVRNSEFVPSTTTEVPVALTTTDMKLLRDNEVELLTTQIQPDVTTEVSDKAEIRESTVARENEVDTKIPTKFDETTNLDEKQEVSTPEQVTDDTTLPQTDAVNNDPVLSTTKSNFKLLRDGDDVFLENNQLDDDSAEEKPPLETTSSTTTTTSTTPVPIIATIESETTNFPDTGETTPEENTGTLLSSTSTSTLPGLLLDFTTSMPFLTSTTITTTTTAATTTPVTQMTTPLIAFNMDDRTNEPLNMETTTLIPLQSSPITTTTATATATATTTTTTTTTTVMEPAPTTTTTTIAPPTTMPAVTVMAATTETETEIQTTETEAHTPAPAIFSNNDMMTQKSNNYDYNSNNDEPLNKTTSNTPENSSIAATEVSTRVAPSYWATSTAETSAAEVDRFDEFDVTTLASFEINNAFETATPQPSTTAATILTFSPPPSITTITTVGIAETSTEDLDHIDTVHKISDTGETSIESNVIDPLHVGKTSTTTTTTTTTTEPTTTTTTTENSQDNIKMQSTGFEELDSSSTTSTSTTTTTTTTTTPRYDDFTTTLQSISTKKEDIYAIVPTIDTGFHVPKLVLDDATTTVSSELALAGIGAGAGGQPMDSSEPQETDVNVIIAISVSVVGIVALILLVAFLYVMRKRQKQMSYGQRCRPVSLDAYSLDNVSVYNSVRRKGAALRASKRSYGNVAFDDPSLRHNVLGTHDLAKFVDKKSAIWEEFKDVPQIIARADEVPAGCEDKNRYANVIPLPETRVVLQHQNGDEKTEYINANYVRGPKDSYNYYIACQAPLETTVIDFWRMIWEQNSRVIIMATDLIENGIDKCAEYLPPSVTLDNHTVFGDFQVTLKNREVKEKYAISTLILKNTTNEECREITHYWYQWPENGVPTDEAAIIAMLLEARSSLKLSTIEPSDNKSETIIIEEDPKAKSEINGNITSEKPKLPSKDQGPLTIHCSPGTGRTGTIIACDIAMRCLEEPKRCVDIPQIVYSVRRGRASAVQTKEQYEFIYKVTHMYATKISNLHNDN